MRFDEARAALPSLGIGISAEPGSAERGVDALALRREHPSLIDFLEYGTDLARGLDDHVRRWASAGLPTTYHFLDLNLEEPGDADPVWLSHTKARATEIGAAWLCGDGGLWHLGARERGHETLMPPILTPASADAMADALAFMMDETGMLVLPENPPAAIYLGNMHILEYFARVIERADTGFLLDCAHLAIYQNVMGLPAMTALDGFPMERIVEVHVAGSTAVEVDGLCLYEDSHVPELLPDTMAIFEHVAKRAPNLRAVVYECEKNPASECWVTFAWLRRVFTRG